MDRPCTGPATISEAFWALLELVPAVGVWKIAPQERLYRLERMRWLLDCLGNPQNAYRILHVAGSKGKGSTAAFLAQALGAAGHITGLYTSPHVADPAERITVIPTSDQLMDGDLITESVARIRDIITSTPVTSLPGGFHWTAFELVTAFAFLYFQRLGCRFAVIETGIGGRWDATNIVNPVACVLTPIDREHTDILGDTLAAIAAEKSGIIKPHSPVFSASQAPEVKQVFRQTSHAQNARIRFLDEELLRSETSIIRCTGTAVTFRLRGMRTQHVRLKLLGDFQAQNAALAYLTLRHTFPTLTCRAITAGFERTFLPGRLELIATAPAIILDGAHTPLAITRILETWRVLFPTPGVLLFGAIAGKNIAAMARLLSPHFRHIIISTPGSFKASHPDQVYAVFQAEHPSVSLKPAPEQALRHARELAQGALPILVTGSFFMVAEIRKLLLQ